MCVIASDVSFSLFRHIYTHKMRHIGGKQHVTREPFVRPHLVLFLELPDARCVSLYR